MNRGNGEGRYARRVGRFFLTLVALTWMLIVFGALVRAHGAGLACPDWPYCFGSLLPRMDFRVLLEYGHRAVAGSLTLLFVLASALALRRPATRDVARKKILLAAVLLGTQIVLGGLTVLHLLARWSVVSHLVTGNLFCLVLLLIARSLLGFGETPRPAPPAVRRLAVVAGALLAIQIVLGGLVSSSYAGLACPDWPTCDGGSWFPTFAGLIGLQLAHRLGAYAVAAAFISLSVASRRVPVLGRLSITALHVVFLQILIGVTNVLWQLPVEVTAMHSAVATLLVLLTTLILRAALAGPAPSPAPARAVAGAAPGAAPAAGATGR